MAGNPIDQPCWILLIFFNNIFSEQKTDNIGYGNKIHLNKNSIISIRFIE